MMSDDQKSGSTQTKDRRDAVEKKPLAKPPVPVSAGKRGLVLAGLDEMWRFATAVVRSGLAPVHFRKPEAIIVALQGGAELGLTPMQSLQCLMVIRGKLGMYVATARALVESHPECEWIKDNTNELSNVPEWKDSVTAIVEAKRRGRPETTRRSFSVSDAKRAKLWGKAGQGGEPSAWILYPARMLYARAMGYCLRDAFGDILAGINTVEELQDTPDDRPRKRELPSGAELDGDALDAMADEFDQAEEQSESSVGGVPEEE